MRNTLTGGPNVKAMSASKVHMMQGIQEDTVQTISSTQKVLRQQIFAAVIKSKCVHIHAQNVFKFMRKTLIAIYLFVLDPANG